MTRTAALLAIAAAFLAGVSLGLSVTAARGATSSPARPVLHLVPVVPGETARAVPGAGAGRTAAPEPSLAAAPGATAAPGLQTATGEPVARLRGTASWYDAGPTDAAAGPALRAALGRGWRGSLVQACAGDRCVQVRLSGWCQCHRGEATERVIDLPDEAFAELAPLSAGLVPVVVSW